jgi:hypothetical protein
MLLAGYSSKAARFSRIEAYIRLACTSANLREKKVHAEWRVLVLQVIFELSDLL